MDTSVCRYDFAPITKCETTDEGFLRVWARAARAGTQLYRRADGSQVREYRPPEEVSSPDSLTTFGMKPATWGHPPVLLDSENTKQYQVGYSGSQVRYNDGFVEVALTVTDKDSIDKIQRKDATEVSAGYKVDFDPTPGLTPEGEDFDGIQRNIRVNHIAIVPRGRAGPEVRLLMDRMDSSDAVSYEPEASQPNHLVSPPLMATVKLDGLEIDLPAETASAVQSYVRDAARSYEAVTAERDEFKTNLDALTAELDSTVSEKEAAEGRADALEERLDELESEQRSDIAEIDQRISERLAVFQQLAPAFAEDYHFDGKDEVLLFAEAYENLLGKAPREDADPSYVQGVVEGVLATQHADSSDKEETTASDEEVSEESNLDAADDRADSTVGLRDALAGAGHKQANPVDAYRSQLSGAWKSTLTATK